MLIKVTKKRLLIVAALFFAIVTGIQIYDIVSVPKETVQEPVEEEKQPILIWYNDKDIEAYMDDAAVALSEKLETEVRIELVSEVDYIETICDKSVGEEMEGPDLYVVSSELLEKARLAGMTTVVEDQDLKQNYPEHAINAMTCGGEVVARPFYLETAFLLYNNYYVDPNRYGVPETIDDILKWSENFEPDEVTERVENIFQWNVADVMVDYMFLGDCMELGGPYGDDKKQVSLDLDKAARGMEYYQNLNEFFAIDADTITSDEVSQDFLEGKTVFAIANVPMLSKIDAAIARGEVPEYATSHTVKIKVGGEEEAAYSGEEEEPEQTEEEAIAEAEAAGEQEYEDEPEQEVIEEEQDLNYESFYGIAMLPALTDELSSRGLSVTNGVVVNPYSKQRALAKTCAKYLTIDIAGNLFEKAGEYPASSIAARSLAEHLQIINDIYRESLEVPKIMELSNIWLWLESTLSDIWRGQDIKEQLEDFDKILIKQLS